VTGWRIRHEESGMTLPEVMVVVAILGVVMLFALQSVASFETAATGGIRRLENLDEARVLMQVLTKDVRTTTRLDTTTSPFVLADDNEVTFYANLNLTTACPKLVHLYIDSEQRLVEDVTQPDGGSPEPTPPNCTYLSGDTTTRLVGRYVANAPTEPIFTYFYDNAGTLTAFDATLTPLSSANGLLVSAIGIELAIRKDTSLYVDHTTLQNRVRLPNVYYNPLPSPTESPSA
jgi:prepilin-type N-terminal cleavage/methylation domain-containing protein